ncbi:MAG TPA: hypothetical protein VET45_11930 [Candidatus Binatia bacterium]|nr:hypothetical protein [Candidatus Binatia bacterium]
MELENLIAYAVVLGLPLWLVAEELLYRFAAGRKAQATVKVEMPTATVKRADLERRAPEGASVHASFV